MQELDVDVSLKVIVVGNGMVGKTSMITRFARGVMTENYKKTIGTDFMEKEIIVRATGDTIRLMLWDTAGQEMFSKLTRSYYKGSGAVVYVFSTTDRESFLEIERWKQKVESECGDICSVLVQNKVDLIDHAVMSKAEVEDLATRLNMKLYRTCVKDNVLVDDVFDYLATCWIAAGGLVNNSNDAVADIGELTVEAAAAAAAAAAAVSSSTSASSSAASPGGAAASPYGAGSPATTDHTAGNGADPSSSSSSSSSAATHTTVTSGRAAAAAASSSQGGGGGGGGRGGTFQLQPFTQRTGGKKRAVAGLCSIV